MDILVEILELVFEVIFHTVGSERASRSSRLIAFAIVFIIMCLLVYLSVVVRDDAIKMWFFILLSGFMAVTLLQSFPKIRPLIRSKED